MDSVSEVIALVLDETDEQHPGDYSQRAKRLVRGPDGTVSLEALESEEEFDRTAKTTGCFRRGKAIRDPDTSEVIGYEMEEVFLVPVAAAM